MSKELSFGNVNFDMEGVLGSDISLIQSQVVNKIIDRSTYTDQVVVGTKEGSYYDGSWYKPWTWLKYQSYTVDIKEDREFIKLGDVVDGMINSIEVEFTHNIQNAEKMGIRKQDELKSNYRKSLKDLESKLSEKLNDFNSFTKELENKENKLKELNKISSFISDINSKVSQLKEL